LLPDLIDVDVDADADGGSADEVYVVGRENKMRRRRPRRKRSEESCLEALRYSLPGCPSQQDGYPSTSAAVWGDVMSSGRETRIVGAQKKRVERDRAERWALVVLRDG
jgi:hypothetical protein